MNVIDWIIEGDVSIEYLAKRDLLDTDHRILVDLQKRILTEGFGLQLLDKQNKDTYLWGDGTYSPKYISTHYTLLELCQLGASLDDDRFHKAINLLFSDMWINKGKVRKYRHQDLCVVAMMVRIACNAKYIDDRINEMVDYILAHQMNDGGWNCAWERKPSPKQSSLHTTLSVLEAFNDYIRYGYNYNLEKIKRVIPQGVEYILSKRMYFSVRTGEIIHKDMLSFPFPYNWKYDILRALELMSSLKIPYDQRMEEAINNIHNRLDEYGRIKADKKPPSLLNIRYTKTNQFCRYNTYRALKVIKYFLPETYQIFISKKIK